MSLQVWLPLNGSLRNNGLNNCTITGTATYKDGGKIGKCINSNATITINTSLAGIREWTFCFWGYVTSSLITTDWTKIARLVTGNFSLRIEVCPKGNYANDIYCYSTHNNPGYTITTGGAIATPNGTNYYDRWAHFCLTSDGSTISKYMDGVLVGTRQYNGSGCFSGCIDLNNNDLINKNDVRFYDHCLSPREIKEISKGLILHYPLKDRYIESTTNLLGSNYTFDICYNGSTGKYQFGAETDIYKESGFFNGKNCVKVKMGTAGLSAYPYVHFNQTKSTPVINGYKTISFDYFPTKFESLVFYSHGTTCEFTGCVNYGDRTSGGTVTGIKINEWNHIEMTIKNVGETTKGCGYVRIGTAAHTSTTTDYWLFSNMQIEEKNHGTVYTPNSRISNNIYWDCSGHSNNGVLSGDISYEKESPRYDFCYNFLNSGKILTSTTCSCYGLSNATLAAWVKPTARTSDRSCIIIGGFYLTIDSSGRLSGYAYGKSPAGYHTGSTIIPLNKWTHIAIVWTDEYIVGYINGKQDFSIACTGIFSINVPIKIGKENDSGTITRAMVGGISDVRIYSTALSEKDIKELCDTPIAISNNGILMTQGELIE